MPYQLKNGVFLVRCRYPGCPFATQVSTEQKIMAMTEHDVEREAKNLVRDIAMTKHDAVYGTRHTLRNPEVRRISGTYQLIGQPDGTAEPEAKEVFYRDFDKGEVILQEGEEATTLCEVIRGSAFADRNRSHRYGIGNCFGASALLANHSRTCNVIAGANGTRIAFYNLINLSKKNSKKASRLFQSVMEDTLRVIQDLEGSLEHTHQEIEVQAVRG
jgi:hypothetical protein